MKVIKIGGSSLTDLAKVKKIIETEMKKDKIILVISAKGRNPEPYATDTLKNLGKNLNYKDLDYLLSVGEVISCLILKNYLNSYNINSYVLNNQELGIITDHNFQNANILKFKTKILKKKLKEYDLLIVPGFQGHTKENLITTLGRDGSDTTAIFLAGKLKLKEVTIISNVAGLYNKDPITNKNSIFIKKCSYDDLLKRKPKVIHLKGLLYAKKKKIIIYFTSVDDYMKKVSKVEYHV